jgi:Holliday junction DNA helicase RuvA
MAFGGSLQAAFGNAPDDGAVLEAVQSPRSQAAPMAQADALSALQNLGYAPSEAASAVARAAGDIPDATTPDLIKAALRLLAPKD